MEEVPLGQERKAELVAWGCNWKRESLIWALVDVADSVYTTCKREDLFGIRLELGVRAVCSVQHEKVHFIQTERQILCLPASMHLKLSLEWSRDLAEAGVFESKGATDCS